MAGRIAGWRFGALFVLAGAILLGASLLAPWYLVHQSFSYGQGGSWYMDTSFYLGPASWNGTVQHSCTPSTACPAANSYSTVTPGVVAEITLVLVSAGCALGVVGGVLALSRHRNEKRTSTSLASAVAAGAVSVAAPEFYALVNQFGLGGLWNSFWGSSSAFNTLGIWTNTWGPFTGWYVSIVGAAAVLVGTVFLVRSRNEPTDSGPSSALGATISGPEPSASTPTTPEVTSTAPPPRKGSRRLLWGVAVVMVTVVVVVYVALASVNATWVRVNGENWGVDYAGTTPSYAPNYLGYPSWSPSSPPNGWTGSSFTDWLTVTSTDYLNSHNITSITVASPFSVASVSPSLPIVVAPGGTVTIGVTLTMPSSGGFFGISGTITTD